ncbi:hypothetical protein AYO44_06210 [Planctomycetaceae bacterium SCGC AG-212-F19]|nr:hypothetical protein AYO44_06210 [Planctomycetaceae bacterium SCGC AG-212-F19]
MQTKSHLPIPADLAAALRAKPKTLAMWKTLRPSCQKRHVEHVLEAKKPATRQRRIAAVLRMTAEWHQRHQAARSSASGSKR